MGTVRNARVNQGGPKCAGIVGLGLIGGSFARGYAQAGVRVLAWDPDDDVMTAASMGTVAGELNDETLGECDIIVLACYPEACIEWLEAHAQALADATDTEAIMGPVVIDTVGVKGIVCERAFELAREHGFYFVGAHPMAGTQYSGYAHSRADLFQGAPLVLVPPAVDDALKLELLGQVREMVRPLGFGKFSVTTAAEHDRVIAFTSQLAHVVSNAYVKSPTAQVHHGFSAGSYRDLTRVAHLNPHMWSELMIDDADALAFEIDHLIESLGAYSRALDRRDAALSGESPCRGRPHQARARRREPPTRPPITPGRKDHKLMAITIDIDTARPYQVHVGTFLLEQAGPYVRATAGGAAPSS